MPLLSSCIFGYETDILSLPIAFISLIIALGSFYIALRTHRYTVNNNEFARLYFNLCSEEYHLWQGNGMIIE